MRRLSFSTALVLCACGTSNGTPNDRNQPQLNLHPAHNIELRAVIPPGLNVHLEAEYSTASPGDDCKYDAGFEVGKVRLTVAVPLELREEGGRKIANFSTDRYVPGNCGWFFTVVRYTMSDSGKFERGYVTPTQGQVAVALEEVASEQPRGWSPAPGELYVGRADLWCREKLKDSGNAVSPQCSPWQIATHIPGQPVSRDESRNAPGSDREDSGLTFVMPSTKLIEVYFHDLDAR